MDPEIVNKSIIKIAQQFAPHFEADIIRITLRYIKYYNFIKIGV
jgi:hypothetical protein